MSIRKKLLVLLLCMSLIPAASYFILDVSFSRIVRGRVQKSLRSALEERAHDTLLQTIDNYDEKLKISAQAVRYGLRHYADQVQRVLWSINIDTEQVSEPRYLVQPSSEDISQETHKYQFLKVSDRQQYTIDFDSQFIHAIGKESGDLLDAQLPQLTKTCREIYSINPETKLWIYTILAEGTVALYPSPGLWPYKEGYDFRNQSWYISAKINRQFTPTPRIEPLTGKTVMTVAMPLFQKDSSFAGVIAIDIDLSSMLDRIQIPQQWQEGTWKLLIKLPEAEKWQVDDVNVICCTSFLQSQEGPGKPSRLVDICDAQSIEEMMDASQQGKAGLMRRPYNGVDSLWVYGSSQPGGGFPILVIPHQRIVEQADNAQRMLFRDNIRTIQIATLLIFAVIVAAVLLAVMRARNVTVPITHLADAAGKLAGGDFDVKVSITTNDELQQLGDVFNQVGPGLKERQKIKQSLELARQIQQHFLPAEIPVLDNFQVAGVCRYCDETGGDYYDIIDLRSITPGRIGLVLGDVSGHGIPAAMLMISAGSILRNNVSYHGDNLSAAISELNSHLVINSEPGKFMTLFYGFLNDEKKTLSWSSAGHDPAIWYNAESTEFSELKNTGMALGIMDDTEFGQDGPINLQPGDIVLIGTDGIWEAQNAAGDMYGKKRLCDLIIMHKDETAQQIASSVVKSVLEFCSDAAPTDDITLLVIKCVC